MRTIRKIAFYLFLVFICINISTQFSFEQEIRQARSTCNFLKEKKRLKHTPVLIFCLNYLSDRSKLKDRLALKHLLCHEYISTEIRMLYVLNAFHTEWQKDSLFLLYAEGIKQRLYEERDLKQLDTTINYVQNFYSKNNWNYPLFINISDTTFHFQHFEPHIDRNRYSIAIKALELALPDYRSDKKAAFKVSNANVYKHADQIYLSLLIEAYYNNIHRTSGSDVAIYKDSSRIYVTGGLALFKYNSGKLSFQGW